MNPTIEKALKRYQKAVMNQDFDTMYACLYEPDIKEYKQVTAEFAEKMDIFGETDDFLKKLNIESVKVLKKMTPKAFMQAIFKMITRKVPQELVQQALDSTKIIEVDETDYLTIITYETTIEYMGDKHTTQQQMNMILSEGQWYFFFKSGLRMALQKFQKQVDDYHERKAKDNLDNLEDPEYLQTYTLMGYENVIDNTIVFEARFKDAGEFSEGLAYVKIITKYGYINLKGEIAIKPRFLKAYGFMEGRAGVQLETDKGYFWGFINKKGKMVIDPQFSEVSYFSKGLCAVEKEGYWGYINKKGEIIIPCKFERAEPFERGRATVGFFDEEGDWRELIFNKKGEVVG